LVLAVVRELREQRAPVGPEELAEFETDVLAGFVLARASAGLADATIRGDVGHLEQVRTWLGKPLWEMQPADADAYFGKVVRDWAKGTRLGVSLTKLPGAAIAVVVAGHNTDSAARRQWRHARTEQHKRDCPCLPSVAEKKNDR
jgi:hypothetical protein